MTPSPRILLIGHQFLGDTLLLTPLLATIKEASPTARISVVIGAGMLPLLENHPWISQLLPFKKKHPQHGFWATLHRLRSDSFDAVIILKPSLTAILLGCGVKATRKVGFGGGLTRFLLGDALPYDATRHHILNLLHLLQRGLPIVTKRVDTIEFSSEKEDGKREKLPAFCPPPWMWLSTRPPATASTLRLALHPFSSDARKDVPLAFWQGLLQTLLDALPPSTSVQLSLLGSPRDADALAPWQAALSAGLPAMRITVDCQTQTPLNQLPQALQHYDALLGVDSGLVHLAATVGVPSLCLFRHTQPSQWHTLPRSLQLSESGERLASHASHPKAFTFIEDASQWLTLQQACVGSFETLETLGPVS